MYYLFPIIWLFKKSRNLSALSCRLTQLTGKSKYLIHPKHLVTIEDNWYLSAIKKRNIILDLGCGSGFHSLKAAQRCKKLIGIDCNPVQLAIAKNIAKEKKIKNVTFIKANLEEKLPFKNNYFDIILAFDILEHLRKRNFFLSEIKKWLKPKGLLYLSVPNKDTSWKKLQRKVGLNSYTDQDHKIEYSLAGIKKVLLKAGLKPLNIGPIVYDTPWTGFIDLLGGISLTMYRYLVYWKKNKVKNNLKESIGFRIKAKIL